MNMMYNTFNIDNMESYFRNFVPCAEHTKQPITNFCTQRICLKFMCPQCVASHSKSYANHPIESIKMCLRKTSNQIKKALKQIEQEANKYNFLKFKSIDQFEKELMGELQKIRKNLVEDINSYFKEKQIQIKNEVSKSGQVMKKLPAFQQQINKVTKQLHDLEKSLFVNQSCVKAIKKANKLDYDQLVGFFKKKIIDLKNEMDFDIRLETNHIKKDQLRTLINNLIQIRSKKGQPSPAEKPLSPMKPARGPLDNYSSPYRQKLLTAHPSLSADRYFNQAALNITMKNYFEEQPFLHFFQFSKPIINILKINSIKENAPLEWETIELDLNFIIPPFSRTVANQSGAIFLLGGTDVQNDKKSKAIYQYVPLTKTLNQVATLNIGRSSHSIVCFKKIIYVVGGMDDQEQIPRRCQAFNTKTRQCKLIAPCKFQTINSVVSSIGSDKLVKIGGVDTDGRNSDSIELYHIISDIWEEVDPIIQQQIKNQFGLLSCCGWAPLNDSQIFIFGGYDQEADNQNSKTSYVFEYNQESREPSIKYINFKNIPVAQGFWNPQSVVHNGNVYALQNVDGDEDQNCLEQMRNVLIFNGKYWSVFDTKL